MTELVFYMAVFLAVGTFFLFIHLMIGKLIRPSKPEAEKLTIYECGEPTVGSAWIQFDLRYYVVALLFVIFDVEVAFFFPWAVVFGNVNEIAKQSETTFESKSPEASRPQEALRIVRDREKKEGPGLPPLPQQEEERRISQPAARAWAWIAFGDILVFFGVLMMGFAYLWRRGDINWVRSVSAEKTAVKGPEELPARMEPALIQST